MGIISLIICVLLLTIELLIFKKKLYHPIVLFLSLWSFILLLSNIHLYSMIPPSDESYGLLLIMIIFTFIGDFVCNYLLKSKKKSIKKNDNYILSQKLYWILYIILIIFLLIDSLIIIKYFFNGEPLHVMRRWGMGIYGKDFNPLLNRRTFVEQAFRKTILTPYQNLIFPISAYFFFNSKRKKEKVIFLLSSVMFLILCSIAGGGGRLSFIYFFGSYLLGFVFMNQNQNKKRIYKKYIYIFMIFGLITVVLITFFRTGNSFVENTYKYFSMPPVLLSLWLPIIKGYSHTYGFLTFFGIHSYFFRILGKIGLSKLIPNIYYDSYTYLLNAEIFRNVGNGVGNAFVSPVYYYYIDGGIPFICIFSILFSIIVSFYYHYFEENNNIRNFVIYCLIMDAVFISFIRIQTTIPNFIISFIFVFLLFRKNKEVKNV